ncbi:MAG: efflux RND transporter periplasmic adaptor subunit [Pseudomonadota bacterium]
MLAGSWVIRGRPVGLAASVVIALCSPAAAQQPPRPAVVVAAAATTDLRPSASFSGRLVAVQQVEIRARVTGFIEALSFTEGAQVDAGAVLYTIEDETYLATADQIRGSIAAAEAELKLAEIERDRKATLVERETVAQSELDIALANLGKVEGQIAQLKAQLDRALLDIGYTEITAPFDGILGLTAFDEGALVSPESGTLVSLTRLDPITVEFPISQAQYLRYHQNTQSEESEVAVMLRLADGTTYDKNGVIDFIDAQVSRSTDTVTVRAVFENPDGTLLDGGLVNVTLEQDAPRPVLSVPQQAVSRDQVGAFVLVVGSDDTVEQRRIETGQTIRGLTVVQGGLEEGELVITEGLNKVRPGIAVDAATAGSDTSGG